MVNKFWYFELILHQNYTLTPKDPKQQILKDLWGSWGSRVWGSRVSRNRFRIWLTTLWGSTLSSGGLESRTIKSRLIRTRTIKSTLLRRRTIKSTLIRTRTIKSRLIRTRTIEWGSRESGGLEALVVSIVGQPISELAAPRPVLKMRYIEPLFRFAPFV